MNLKGQETINQQISNIIQGKYDNDESHFCQGVFFSIKVFCIFLLHSLDTNPSSPSLTQVTLTKLPKLSCYMRSCTVHQQEAE